MCIYQRQVPSKQFDLCKFLILLGISTPILSQVDGNESNSNKNSLPSNSLMPLTAQSSYESENPWIGSHALTFSPNPFFSSQSRQLESPDHIVLASTVESPSTFIPASNIPNSQQEPTSKPPRKRKKIQRKTELAKRSQKKRKSRIYEQRQRQNRSKFVERSKARWKPTNSGKKYFQNLPKKIALKVASTSTPEKEPISVESEFNEGKIEFLPIDKVSINPAYQTRNMQVTTPIGHSSLPTWPTVAPTEYIVMTTSMTDGKRQRTKKQETKARSGILDYSAHPEKLDSSYFRDMIVKTMMDKLSKVKIVSYAPTLTRVTSRNSN